MQPLRHRRRLFLGIAAMEQDSADESGADRVDACSLGDMPFEILTMIGASLTSLRDVGAWAIATGLPASDRSLCAMVQSHHDHRDYERIIEAGAPLVVVSHLLRCGMIRPHPALVGKAARGGRVDVLRHVWSAVVDSEPGIGPGVRRAPGHHSAISGGGGCVYGAIKCAVSAGRTETLRWLLAKAVGIQGADMGDAVKAAVEFGLREGLDDVLRDAHALVWSDPRRCPCSRHIAKAVAADRPDVLDRLKAAGCPLAGKVSGHHLDTAVRKGSLGVVRWIAAAAPAPITVGRYSMRKAASRGHVGTLAFAHDSGLGECPPEALSDAVAAGHLDVLAWAAGEGASVPARPLVPWYGTHLAYAAVATGRRDIVEWMTKRPDARDVLGVGVARKALASGMWPCAVVLHDHGLAPFYAWDALTTAVRRGDLSVVGIVAECGGRCDVAALVAALCHEQADALAFLCARYGTDHLQEAVDAVAGLSFGQEPVEWVVANAPDVCAQQLVQQQRSMQALRDYRACKRAGCRPPDAEAT